MRNANYRASDEHGIVPISDYLRAFVALLSAIFICKGISPAERQKRRDDTIVQNNLDSYTIKLIDETITERCCP